MSDAPDPQHSLSPGTLRGRDWFPTFEESARGGLGGAVVKLLIGLLIGGLFFALGWRTLAIVAWVLAGLAGVASIASSRARSGLESFFAKLGQLLGRALSWLLLAPLFIVVFPAWRAWNRLTGADPLDLRSADAVTWWKAVDSDARKRRHAGSLFVTEPRAGRGGLSILGLGVLAFVVLLGCELGLRVFGYGKPILYVPDMQVGYYPAPDQDVRRSGGRVITNAFGMRSGPIEAEKPAGTYRILMLGDSTLWGGSYIDQPDLYSNRLERALNEAAKPDVRFEVLNVSANGWGPFHELGWVEKNGVFGADLALICGPPADVLRARYGLEQVPFRSIHHPPRLALTEVAYVLAWRYRVGRVGRVDAVELQAQRGVAAYGELARRLKADGCQVAAELFPGRGAGLDAASETLWLDELRATFAAEGVSVGFPGGHFADKGDPDELFHDPWHLDTLGHEVYAEYLFSRLSRRSDIARLLVDVPRKGRGDS
ncbi:MAG: hypothetical protein AAF533_19325 [Acidobacteriota bacterium]